MFFFKFEIPALIFDENIEQEFFSFSNTDLEDAEKYLFINKNKNKKILINGRKFITYHFIFLKYKEMIDASSMDYTENFTIKNTMAFCKSYRINDYDSYLIGQYTFYQYKTKFLID